MLIGDEISQSFTMVVARGRVRITQDPCSLYWMLGKVNSRIIKPFSFIFFASVLKLRARKKTERFTPSQWNIERM